MKRISVIIPTCEGNATIGPLLTALQAQTLPPDEMIVVDSESTDGTPETAERLGAKVIRIRRCDFDHGGTRDMALRCSLGDLVLFLTQDALPCDALYIEHLIAPFADERVAAVSGRQIAKADARPFEKAIRAFSYPASSHTWNASAIPKVGVQAFLVSDVCSAYRRSAYERAGGFEHPVITNEDMLMAARLLDAGYKLAYAGDAAVYHSHRYSFMQEYRRNDLIGRFMQRYHKELHDAKETSQGIKLVKYVLNRLWKERQLGECISFCFHCAARLLGNRMGRMKERKSMLHAKG